MFSRSLKSDEVELLHRIAGFIKETAARKAADVSHSFEVVRLSIEIGQKIPHPVNPLVLILTALFHDLGERVAGESPVSGFVGAALAESLLRVTTVSDVDRMRIVRAVALAGPREIIPPESTEEKVVADAQRLARMGIMGVLQMALQSGAAGTHILHERLTRARTDYEGLHFDESKRIGEPLYQQTKILTESLEKASRLRPIDLSQIPLPVGT